MSRADLRRRAPRITEPQMAAQPRATPHATNALGRIFGEALPSGLLLMDDTNY